MKCVGGETLAMVVMVIDLGHDAIGLAFDSKKKSCISRKMLHFLDFSFR